MAYLRAMSIDHVNMNVKNLNESVEFYVNLFGFELKKEQPEDKSMIIGNETIKLCLYELPDKAIPGGICHVGFHIDNFDAVVGKCEEMNIPMPFGIVQWESSRSVYITDPNGYELELAEIHGGGL